MGNVIDIQGRRRMISQSRDGWVFDRYESTWRLDKNNELRLEWTSRLSGEIRESFLNILHFYAINFSASHASNMCVRSKKFFEYSDYNLEVKSLIAYRWSLGSSQEHYLGSLKGFFCTWYRQGQPGITAEFYKTLKAWKLKGNEVGRAVIQMDSQKGPLTDIEMQGVIDGLIDCYSQSRLRIADFSLILTLIHTGRRPKQVVSLKIKDLLSTKKDEAYSYSINIPRSKQRHALWRSTFNTCSIDDDLWMVLQLQSAETVEELQSIVRFQLSESLVKELPIFHDFAKVSSSTTEEELREFLSFDYLHASIEVCNTALSRFSRKNMVFSERTGEPLSLTTRRFRYTLGTNIARQGYGVSIVAEVLDHSNIYSAGYYIKSLPDIVDRIDKAVAHQLAPLAQAFQGVLVASEKNAVRGEDMNSRISNGRANVGTCGSYGFCGALAPIACYTCMHFQPWADGPHEEVLNELLASRERILSISGDVKIASANDRLILAVTEVVQRCVSLNRADVNG